MYRYAIQFFAVGNVEIQDILQVLDSYGERKELITEVIPHTHTG